MKAIFITLFTVCSIYSYSQNAYYDAVFLSTKGRLNFEKNDFEVLHDMDSVFIILDNYVEPNRRNTGAEINAALHDNPFIHVNIKDFSGKEKQTLYPYYNANTNKYGDLTFRNGNFYEYAHDNDTNNLNFLERIFKYAKDKTQYSEKYLTFLNILQHDFSIDTSLKTLFPQAANVLNLLNTEIFEINSFYDHLRVAFYNDLNNLNSSVGSYIFSPYFESLVDLKRNGVGRTKETVQSIRAAHYLAMLLAYNDNPADVFSSLVNNDFEKGPIKNSLQIVGDFSQSLRSIDSSKLWIDENQLTDMLNSKNQFNFYLGLLYQQLKNQGKAGFLSKNISSGQMEKIKSKLFDIIHKKQGVQQFYTDIYQKNKVDNYEWGKEYFKRMKEVLLDYFDLINTMDSDNLPDKYFEHYIELSGYMHQVYLSTGARHYLEAITNVAILLNHPSVESEKSENVAKSLLKYGGFMAGFVQATTPAGIHAVMDRYVFPLQRPKSELQTSSMLLSFDAYVGLFGGIKISSRNDTNVLKYSAGTTLPVGMKLTFYSKQNRERRLSVFAPVLDIGALNVFSFKKGSVLVSDLTWQNVFSPGLHIAYKNLFNTPLTLMLGVQKSPKSFLDKFGVQVFDNSLRFRLAIAYDIPILNLYGK